MANNNISKRLVFTQKSISFLTYLLNIAILFMQKKYDSKQIQLGWKYCFNAQCPKRNHRLRFQSTLEILDDNVHKSRSALPFRYAKNRPFCVFIIMLS